MSAYTVVKNDGRTLVTMVIKAKDAASVPANPVNHLAPLSATLTGMPAPRHAAQLPRELSPFWKGLVKCSSLRPCGAGFSCASGG